MKMFCLNIVINIISSRIYENIVWQFGTFWNKHIAVLVAKGPNRNMQRSTGSKVLSLE